MKTERAEGSVRTDKLIRRELRGSDPSGPEQVAKTRLKSDYKKTTHPPGADTLQVVRPKVRSLL